MRQFLALLLLMLLVAPALAEEPAPEELEEITVTATKTPRKVEEVSASVDVVAREDIEATTGWSVGEAIDSLSGVQAESKNGAYDTHIIIRGAGAKASYGVREIMIMVDGVPITDPDSFTRLDMVDTSMIEKIEVVKGPNSTLYGANAAGGVINIITKSPFEYQGFKIKAGYGSNNSQDYHLQFGGSVGKFAYLLSASRKSTDSWRVHNEFESNQFNARFNYLIDESSDIELSLSYTQADLELPGSLTKEEFEADHTQQSSEWRHTARDSEVWRLSLSYNKEFSEANDLEGQVYVQDWEHFHPVPTKINDGGAVVYGADIQDNIHFSVAGMKSLLSVGVSAQRDNKDAKAYTYRDLNVVGPFVVAPYSLSNEKGDLMEEDDNTVDKWGVFLQNSLWITDGTILDLGLRYDQVKFDIHTEVYKEWRYSGGGFNYVDNRETIFIDKTWDSLSPRVGINHALAKGLNIYGSISTGFQTPAQSELETNTNLKPQKALNYEAGIKWKPEGGHSLDLAFFYTSLTDEIIKLMDATGLSYYDNAGETIHRGIEVSGNLRLAEGLTVGANYAYSDFTFKDYDEMERAGFPPVIITHSRDGNRIPLVPEHKYSVNLNYKHPSGLYTRLSSTTWGKYYVDTANEETYKGFTTVGWRVGYDRENLGLFLQVDNLLDEKYAAEVSVSYGNVKYSPGAPRTLMAGLTYKF